MSESVIIYTMDDCIECTFVKKVLSEKGISYEERNISKSEQYIKEVEQYGFLGVPVTVVNERAVKGMNEELLELVQTI